MIVSKPLFFAAREGPALSHGAPPHHPGRGASAPLHPRSVPRSRRETARAHGDFFEYHPAPCARAVHRRDHRHPADARGRDTCTEYRAGVTPPPPRARPPEYREARARRARRSCAMRARGALPRLPGWGASAPQHPRSVPRSRRETARAHGDFFEYHPAPCARAVHRRFHRHPTNARGRDTCTEYRAGVTPPPPRARPPEYREARARRARRSCAMRARGALPRHPATPCTAALARGPNRNCRRFQSMAARQNP